ncbi:MAG: hypothetical protein QOK03_662 [Candidatus Binataceae bacterium]|nr:hypothetical protein [Candidatus Binataceae bacterium]
MEGRRLAGKNGVSKRIDIELPEELFEQLMRVAEAMGVSNPAEAATIGLAEWVARRKSELDDRDPNEKYVVNEALDELLEKKK